MDGPLLEPRISVALATRNRPESLRRTLRSLVQQDVQPWEVVVSDDSDDASAAEVRKIVEEFGFQYLRGPRRGLYANRNHAALACTGTHVRTMDDDHEFPPGHFRVCLQTVRSYPDRVWIIGETYPDPRDTRKQSCPGQLHPRGFAFLPADADNCWAISDGATIYPISIFQRGIRFAEYYRFGAAYLEFGSRLYWLGYRIGFLPSTAVIHHYDVKTRSYQDKELDRSSRLFAALCHSFVYQPTLRNKLLCCLQIAQDVLLRKGYRSWRSASSAYREHKKTLVAEAITPASLQTATRQSP